MSDLFDYLDWRGDISFKESPFNEVDNIIFCQLSYIKYDGIVPEVFNKSVLLKDAAKADYSFNKVPDPRLYALLERAGEAKRYENVRLTGYIDIFKAHENCQFAAMTFLYDDGCAYVSYRGTDCSLTGFKEDFAMAFKAPIPSQPNGVKYLGKLLKGLPWWKRRKTLMLGGHSKGGNVAQYTAIHSPKKAQKKISVIWSNDGPGFNEDFFPKNWSLPFVSRMKTYMPSNSIIGRFFEHQEECVSIASTDGGVGSHDPFTWKVTATGFERALESSKQTEKLDLSFRDWLTHISLDERAELTEAVFSVLEDMGISSLFDFRNFKLSQALTLVKKLSGLDEAHKKSLVHGITQFAKSYRLNQ